MTSALERFRNRPAQAVPAEEKPIDYAAGLLDDLLQFEGVIELEGKLDDEDEILGELTVPMPDMIVPDTELKFDMPFEMTVEPLKSQAPVLKLDKVPRTTVLNMLRDTPLEVDHVFNVRKGGGNDYVRAIRSLLSRIRAKAISQRKHLDEWKLLTVSVEQLPTHDVVTMLRTKEIKKLRSDDYKDIFAALENTKV